MANITNPGEAPDTGSTEIPEARIIREEEKDGKTYLLLEVNIEGQAQKLLLAIRELGDRGFVSQVEVVKLRQTQQRLKLTSQHLNEALEDHHGHLQGLIDKIVKQDDL